MQSLGGEADIDETGWKITDWIYMAWKRDKQRVRVNTAVKFVMFIKTNKCALIL
jgi:hypothetical protein